jgi:hypothetical protein
MSQHPAKVGSGALRTAASPGFVVLGCLLGCVALEAATVGDRSWGIPVLLARALLAGVGVTSALAAEALWKGRGWVRGAVAAWAVALPVAVGIAATVVAARGVWSGRTAVLLGVLWAGVIAVPCLLVLAWVRQRVARPRP